MVVLGVSGEEGEGEAEGFVFWALAEEIESVFFVALGDVDLAALAIVIPVFSGVGFGVIKFICGEFSVMPFSNLPDVVAIGTKEGRICFCEGGFPGSETATAVTSHPLTGEEGGSADAADGCGDTVFGEADTGGGEFVEVWSLDDGVPRNAKGVVSPIISEENEDVHFGFCEWGDS